MFDFSKDYRLHNERAELIPLQKTHLPVLFELAQDPDIWVHFEEKGLGEASFGRYIERALENRVKKEQYTFAIKDLKQEQFAGMTRIYAVDNSLKNAKIGHTWLGSQFHRTGLNKQAKYLLFKFLFEDLQMERIGFGASAENIKSIKAMESIGCVQEGRLRHFLPSAYGLGRVDIVLLSLLKHEWEAHVKAHLEAQLAVYL